MAELGKYAGAVLSAYGVSLVLLGGLVVLTLWRSLKVRRELEGMERRRNG